MSLSPRQSLRDRNLPRARIANSRRTVGRPAQYQHFGRQTLSPDSPSRGAYICLEAERATPQLVDARHSRPTGALGSYHAASFARPTKHTVDGGATLCLIHKNTTTFQLRPIVLHHILHNPTIATSCFHLKMIHEHKRTHACLHMA